MRKNNNIIKIKNETVSVGSANRRKGDQRRRDISLAFLFTHHPLTSSAPSALSWKQSDGKRLKNNTLSLNR